MAVKMNRAVKWMKDGMLVFGLLGCTNAFAYNLAWLNEKEAAGVPFVENKYADGGSHGSTKGAVYAFTAATNWTDNALPHAGAVYLGNAMQMRLNTTNYNFPGDGFILPGGETFYMHQAASFGYVGVETSSTIQGWQKVTFGLTNGVVDIASGQTLTLKPSVGGGVTLGSEIKGAGDVKVLLYNGTDAPGTPSFAFSGVNTNWTGSLLVRQSYSTQRSWPNINKGYVIFKFSDGRALGGAKDAFAYDALTLACFSRFTPTASTQLADGLNRGIYIGDTSGAINAGFFSIDENITLTNHWPLTVNGTVYKVGAGTLELASDCRFLDDTVPVTETRHTFVLSNGTVRVSHVDALNGLIVDVSSPLEKALALDLAKTSGDLFAFGIRNTRTATPFVGEALPIVFENVTLENLTAIFWRGGLFGLTTVSDDAADATALQLAALALPEVPDCDCSLTCVANDDDTTTFALQVRRVSLVVPLDLSGSTPVTTPIPLPADYAFPAGEKVGIKLSQKIPLPFHNGATLPLVTYTGTHVLTPEMFEDQSEKTYDLPRTTLVVTTEGGVQTVSAVVRPVVCDVAACCNLDETFDGTADSWSDGQAVHRDADYLRTQKLKKSGSEVNYGAFSGDSLTIACREAMTAYKNASIPMTAGGEPVRVYGWRTGTGTSAGVYGIRGELFLGGAYADDPVSAYAFYPYLNLCDGNRYAGKEKTGQCTLTANLSGEGPLYMKPTQNVSITGLLGDNTNYFGRIFLDGKEDEETSYRYGMHVRVKQENNFGGRLTAFHADAITLQNMAYFRAQANIALTNDMNRGITFQNNGGGFVIDSGYTLALGWPMHLDAGIQKHGAGTLRLAGLITKGPNYVRGLTVTEGVLAVANDAAVAGLDVVFSNGVTLALAPNLTTGFSEGFTVLDADDAGTAGEINVAVDLPVSEKPANINVCICETNDPDLGAKLRPVPLRGYEETKISCVPIAEGRYRYAYSAIRVGFVLMFR